MLCRIKLMVVPHRFIIASLVMAGFIIAWRLLFSDLLIIGTIAAVLVSMVMVFLYGKELRKTLGMIQNRKRKE